MQQAVDQRDRASGVREDSDHSAKGLLVLRMMERGVQCDPGGWLGERSCEGSWSCRHLGVEQDGIDAIFDKLEREDLVHRLTVQPAWAKPSRKSTMGLKEPMRAASRRGSRLRRLRSRSEGDQLWEPRCLGDVVPGREQAEESEALDAVAGRIEILRAIYSWFGSSKQRVFLGRRCGGGWRRIS